MTSVKDIFMQALEYESKEERLKFVGDACRDDQELRRLVEALLEAEDDPASFLDRPAMRESMIATASFAPNGSVTEGPGSQIGSYKLLQTIGQGGFGVVYMAEQQEPVRRTVALKIIKPGMDTREVIARFEAERQALALMNHPNIARVLDAGTTDSGRPYFVMELVKGIPLTRFCDANSFTPTQRLELFVSICHAVQHAHQKGVIHRDLKPSNVMVTLFDGKPVPKIIDFGISKAISQRLTEKTLFTRYGQMVGTPAYMSPEQAEMSGLDIDTRSDVYSLGVILYELLVGTTPLDDAKLREAGYAEMLRLIKEEEAPKPSSRLTTMREELTPICERRSTDPKQLGDLIRRELDWIVLKALEKDRNRRYATANELAEEVQRHLDGEPVYACPPTFVYRLSKFTRRYRTQAVVAGAIGIILVISTILSWSLYARAQMARDEAQYANEQLVHETAKARESEKSAVISQNETFAAKKSLEQRLYSESIARAASVLEKNRPSEARRLLQQFNPDQPSWEYNRLKNLVPQVERIPISKSTVLSFNTSPDNDLCVIAEVPATIKVINLKSRKTLWTNETSISQPAVVRFSPRGNFIAIATSAKRRTAPAGIELWSIDGKRIIKEHSKTELYNLPVFSPDERQVFISKASQQGGSMRVVDLSTLKATFERQVRGLGLGAFDHAGQRLVVAFATGFDMFSGSRVRCYDLEDNGEVWRIEHPVISRPTLEPKSGHFILGGVNHDLNMIDVNTGQTVDTIRGNLPGVAGITEFSPNGEYLLSTGFDGQIGIWNWRTKRLAQSFLSRATVVPSFRSNSQFGVIGPDRQTLEFNSIVRPQLDLTLDSTSEQISALRFIDEEPGRLQSLDRAGVLRTWNLRSGMEEEVQGPLGSVSEATFISGRNQLAVGDKRGLHLIDLDSLKTLATFPMETDWWYTVQCSKDQNTIAACSEAGVMIVSLEDGKSFTLDQFAGESRGITFIDESTIAIVSQRAQITVVNLRTKASRLIRKSSSVERSRPICWLAESSQLVIGIDDKLEFWDVKSGVRVKVIYCEGKLITEIIASPKSERLFVGDSDGVITVWSLESNERLIRLHGHERGTAMDDYILGVQEMQLADDGETLVSGGRAGRICVWESRAPSTQDSQVRELVAAATKLVNRLSASESDADALSVAIRNDKSISAAVKPYAQELVINLEKQLANRAASKPFARLLAQLRLDPGWLERLQSVEIERFETRASLVKQLAGVTNIAIDQSASSLNEMTGDDVLRWTSFVGELASLPIRKTDLISLATSLTAEHPDCPLPWYICADVHAAMHNWRMAKTMFERAHQQVDRKSALGLLIATKLLALESRLSEEPSSLVGQCEALAALADGDTPSGLRLRISRICMIVANSDTSRNACARLIEDIDPARLPPIERPWFFLTEALVQMRSKQHETSLESCDQAFDCIVKQHRLSIYARATILFVKHLNGVVIGTDADNAKQRHGWLLHFRPFLDHESKGPHRDWELWIIHNAVSSMSPR